MQRREQSFAYHLAADSWLPTALKSTRTDLGGGVRAGARARRAIAADFARLTDVSEQELMQLLVTELVNNAVSHGGAEGEHHVILHVCLAPARIRAEVCDGGPGFDPESLPPRAGHPGGMGLVVLDGLASRWGVSSEEGTCVWFELDR